MGKIDVKKAVKEEKKTRSYKHGQNIWEKLYIWGEIPHYGKFRFLFSRVFLLLLTKISFLGDWAPGYNSMNFWHYSELS